MMAEACPERNEGSMRKSRACQIGQGFVMSNGNSKTVPQADEIQALLDQVSREYEDYLDLARLNELSPIEEGQYYEQGAWDDPLTFVLMEEV